VQKALDRVLDRFEISLHILLDFILNIILKKVLEIVEHVDKLVYIFFQHYLIRVVILLCNLIASANSSGDFVSLGLSFERNLYLSFVGES